MGGGGIDHPPKWVDIWGQLLGKCAVTAIVGGSSATTYKIIIAPSFLPFSLGFSVVP